MAVKLPVRWLVLAILGALCALAYLPIEKVKRGRAEENILKEDLHSMREAIDQYAQDKNEAPASLDDLVRAGYLHEIPMDPITHSRFTWKLIYEEQPAPDDLPAHRPKDLPKKHGITDVQCGSNRISSEGIPYNTW